MNKDTNCNDLIEFQVLVNGQIYHRQSATVNTQQDWAEFQAVIAKVVANSKLEQMSRFKPA